MYIEETETQAATVVPPFCLSAERESGTTSLEAGNRVEHRRSISVKDARCTTLRWVQQWEANQGRAPTGGDQQGALPFSRGPRL